jgi:hypothetical protein
VPVGIGVGAWLAGITLPKSPIVMPGARVIPDPPGTMVGVAVGIIVGLAVGAFIGITLPAGPAFCAIAIPAIGAASSISTISPRTMHLILIIYHPLHT